MRSIRLLAVATTVLVLVSACGGDDPPTGGGNEAPVATFTAPSCTAGAACAFTADPSTDDNAVTGWGWDFNGDLTNEATTKDASFTFAAAGSVPVRLIVSDAEGLADTVINNVTVAPATPGNVNPVASFELATACTAGTPCGFHSTSTDADGTIATAAWQFGDAETGEGIDVTHTYAAAGTFQVTLTVTDNVGGTGTVTQPVIVSPAASQDCTTTGTVVDCSLTMTQRVTVKFTVVSRSCELTGNRLETTAPEPDQIVFFNLCNRTPGEEYTLRDAGGLPLVLEASTVMGVHFVQGTADVGDPATGDPGIEVDGAYPNWTLRIDDGGNAGIGGEPDFDDAVISVQATVAP